MTFSYTLNHRGSICVFSLSGRIIAESDLDKILVEITNVFGSKKNELIFNLEELEYVNSAGINFFMRTLTKARINNGDLIFCGVKNAVENLFKIAKLNRIYTIYSSENEAINHFKKEVE